MKTGALACIAIGLASHVALADPLRLAQAMMPPREVVLVVRSAGLLPTSEPALTGTTYVVRAVDRHGTPLRVAIDARNGYILSVRRFAVTEPTHPPYGALGMRDTDLVPPRAIPPSAAPVRPPLPKPRAATVLGESAKPPAEPSPEPLSRPAPPPANQAAKQESFPPVTPLQ